MPLTRSQSAKSKDDDESSDEAVRPTRREAIAKAKEKAAKAKKSKKKVSFC
jgi:hypothetical protein